MTASWLIWTILAVISWGIWALISKLLGDVFSAAQNQALSTIGILPIIIALLFWPRQQPTEYRFRGSILAFSGGFLTCCGNIAYYHALNLGGKAAMVVPLTALYPLVTVILAFCLLKEKSNFIQIAGIALSLFAIYLFNIPSNQKLVSSWIAYALIPIVLWGISALLQKVSTNYISGELSTIWFLIAFIPVAALILIQQPIPASTSGKSWLLVIMLGLFFAFGNFALLLAFAANGRASIIAPLAALYPLVTIPLSIILLGEKIGTRESIAILVALIAGVALSFEKREKLDQLATGSGSTKI